MVLFHGSLFQSHPISECGTLKHVNIRCVYHIRIEYYNIRSSRMQDRPRHIVLISSLQGWLCISHTCTHVTSVFYWLLHWRGCMCNHQKTLKWLKGPHWCYLECSSFGFSHFTCTVPHSQSPIFHWSKAWSVSVTYSAACSRPPQLFSSWHHLPWRNIATSRLDTLDVAGEEASVRTWKARQASSDGGS